MKLMVNGFWEEIDDRTTLTQLIEMMREQAPGLIVEINGRFVHPRDYDTQKMTDGDRIEMIHPAFGG